jgi:hypothetical protein
LFLLSYHIRWDNTKYRQRLSECHLRDALLVSSNVRSKNFFVNDQNSPDNRTETDTITPTPPKPIIDRIVDTATTKKKNTTISNNNNKLDDNIARELFVSPAESSLGFASIQSPTPVKFVTSTNNCTTKKDYYTPQTGSTKIPVVQVPPIAVTTLGPNSVKTPLSTCSSTSSRISCGTSTSFPGIVRNNTASTTASNSSYPTDMSSSYMHESNNRSSAEYTTGDWTRQSPSTTNTHLSEDSTAPTSLCRMFLRDATPIEKGSVLTFLSLLQIVDMNVYESLIQLCERYYPNDTDVIIIGLQTVATVVSNYVSTWFVTSFQLDNSCDKGQSSSSSSIEEEENGKIIRQINNHLSSRMVDFFLVSHPLMPVYYAVAVFVINSKNRQQRMDQPLQRFLRNDTKCNDRNISLTMDLHTLFQHRISIPKHEKIEVSLFHPLLENISRSVEDTISLSLSYM